MRRFPLMIFAAGFGTRMGALTADRPKPLVPLAGRPLIDHALDHAGAVALGRPVVNLHYLGDQIERHLAGRDAILSWERGPVLETGGGLKAALPLMAPGPVMALNSDAAWAGPNPLETLARTWRDDMGGLLLVGRTGALAGRKGRPADFHMDAQGRLTRARGATQGVVYLGAQILQPDPVAAWTERVFSLNRIWDALIAEGRLFGVDYPGGWCDVGTPEGLAEAETLLARAGHG